MRGSHPQLDQALEFFANRTWSVRRHTGGLALAETVQIVLFEEPNQETSIRVKVRFRDLGPSRNGRGELVCLTHTKIVPPDELLQPFSFKFEGPEAQAFALDLGKGIVPIQVIGYHEHGGTSFAYFLEAKDGEHLASIGRKKSTRVPIYRVERSALRWIGAANRTVPNLARERAQRNYLALQRAGWKVLPNELMCGHTVEVPASILPDEIGSYLRVDLETAIADSHFHLETPNDEEETFLSFHVAK